MLEKFLDSICASCGREVGNGWEDIQAIVQKMLEIHREKERVVAELVTKQKKQNRGQIYKLSKLDKDFRVS